MRTNTQEAVLLPTSRPSESVRRATLLKTRPELCRLANLLNRLNEIACSLRPHGTARAVGSKTYKPGSKPCWNARAWSSTTSTVIRQATQKSELHASRNVRATTPRHPTSRYFMSRSFNFSENSGDCGPGE